MPDEAMDVFTQHSLCVCVGNNLPTGYPTKSLSDAFNATEELGARQVLTVANSADLSSLTTVGLAPSSRQRR